LLDKVFGDGKQVISFTPWDTRPNYYVVRVDSFWGVENEDEPSVGDFTDDLYTAVEDQFGNAAWCACSNEEREKPCEEGECVKGGEDWPALHDFTGCCSWGRLWLDDDEQSRHQPTDAA
jgi:hypothetical protein